MMTGMSVRALDGYGTPDGAIELASPLRNGRFIILHGGTNRMINAHAKIHPQDYALDILQLNSFGNRASLFADPQDLTGYEIFGTPLYSPCNGTIVAAVDEFDDLTPPEMDPEHLAGNHVLIACDGIEVLLAHMKKGSVAVQVGDAVTTETELGQVGNTGNTSEPHLHIHAERGGEPGIILDGTAVPFTIGGRFLVRNEIIDN
ncbi:MAG: M23 family metallopeptidase [Chloroflexi bacterium]|nr:M23 family metallopeptidase [Chloroflexota bacterium]